MVRIDLRQREEELPIGADGGDEGDPGMNLLGVHAVHDSSLSPAPPPVVLQVDPGLIHIDDALAFSEQSYQRLREHLPEDQTAGRVASEGDPLQRTIGEVQVLLHGLSHQQGIGHQLVRLLDLHDHILRPENAFRCFVQLCRGGDDGFLAFGLPLLGGVEFC